jgi:hypothetical protein
MFKQRPVTSETIEALRLNLSFNPNKMSPEPVCDFCADSKPTTQYAAWQMSTGEVRDCWRWVLCDRCSALVNHNQWHAVEDLLVKVMRRMASHTSNDLLLTVVRRFVKDFRAHAVEDTTADEASK